MIRSAINGIINVGVTHAHSTSDKRNIQLTNFISFGLAICLFTIVIVRYYLGTLQLWFYVPLALEGFLFIALILGNAFGAYNFSRFALCWIPSVVLIVDFKILITHVPVPETSHYVGFRLFQLAFSFFPFLVFGFSEIRKMIPALSVPVVSIILYDWILEKLGVGYIAAGITDSSYTYNGFRTIIALLLIAAAFTFLRRLLEKQEIENGRLIAELADKNALIQRNAERELKKTYDKLRFHINNTPLAVIERDKNFHITFWNKRAEELFGWTAAEVAGRRPQDFLVDVRDLQRGQKMMDDAVANKLESYVMDLHTVTKKGAVLNCLWYYSFLHDEQGEIETIVSFISDITEQRSATYALSERVKELRTLYNVSQLLTSPGKSMHEVFDKLPALVPPGWQYPDVCAARLTVFSSSYKTENFKETVWRQSVPIVVDNQDIGFIEVVYLDPRPHEVNGPFFEEEKELLMAIAQMLQVYIERALEEQEVLKTQANLEATINNTNILIWSVDHNFKRLTYNNAFRKFAAEVMEVDLDKGGEFSERTRAIWADRYKRVMAGEVLTFEDPVRQFDFKFSLNPIIENNKIIGVNVFGDNVTEQNRQNRALAEANKKIAELKVMALRSVMNPHFIFNVLSSIQYFITRNDELNAINYLTSFSKLMRTVLTRSVADSVTLQEEIDLLKDYVHLEKLRFDEKFDFRVECDHSVEVDDIRLPSLLIQPYVENAILHGLYNKDGKGLLNLKVFVDGEFLIFNIEDDGIGREAAMKIRQQSASQRKSMGTHLTEERLTIINGDAHPPVTYTDLFKDNQAAGTRVTVRIKINPN